METRTGIHLDFQGKQRESRDGARVFAKTEQDEETMEKPNDFEWRRLSALGSNLWPNVGFSFTIVNSDSELKVVVDAKQTGLLYFDTGNYKRKDKSKIKLPSLLFNCNYILLHLFLPSVIFFPELFLHRNTHKPRNFEYFHPNIGVRVLITFAI